MIDFRYHIVSIASVFLALALGLVLGATVLNGAAVSDLEKQVGQLVDDKQALRAEVQQQRQAIERGEAFVTELAPRLVAGQLSGRRVIVVDAPGADKAMREAATEMLESAGAVVTALVDVDTDLFSPDQLTIVDTLASRLAQPDVTLPVSGPVDRASTVLAGALLDRSQPAAMSPADQAVLAGFQEAGLVHVDAGATAGSLAVVITGRSTVPSTEAQATAGQQPVTSGLLTLVGRLEAAGLGTVVIGPTERKADSTFVGVVRRDASAARVVSTVDDADVPAGQVRLVFALAAELHGGVGHYGSGTGATAVLASPAPG